MIARIAIALVPIILLGALALGLANCAGNCPRGHITCNFD